MADKCENEYFSCAEIFFVNATLMLNKDSEKNFVAECIECIGKHQQQSGTNFIT